MILHGFNFRKMSIVSVCFFVFGIIFGYILFPMLLKKMIKGQINVAPDSAIRPLYTKVPFPIDFRVYVFNVTNKDEVTKGAKPKLQQVGPYYFEEWKEKYDLVDDEESDTLTYNYKNTFIYKKEKNGPGLTGDEIVTMPNPLIFGMALAVNVDKKPMLPTIAGAINELFHHPADAFWTGRVMDILYDGVPIDCTSEEFNAVAICSQFATGEMKAVRPTGEKTYAFSLFAGTNGTDLGQFKVFRGKKVSSTTGKVISYNGDEEMDAWDADECNQYVGTDSTIFPAFLGRDEGIWAYEPSICRSLGAHYVSKAEYNGIPLLRYELDLGNPINHKDCFCRDMEEKICPPKGTFDLFKCAGSPMFGSHPHFYNADPSLLEKVEGLSPNKENHGVTLLFESMTGSPLSAAKRLQFNLEVVPIPEIEQMSQLQEMMLPLFWVEEGAHLNRTITDPIKNSLFLMIKIVGAIKWVCIILGAIGGALGGYFHFKRQNSASRVEEVRPVEKPHTNGNAATNTNGMYDKY